MSGFGVKVEREGRATSLWRVSITLNGYHWNTLPVPFSDRERAERVAATLRVELAPEAERLEREIEAS